jgi:tetratricopeptide (TPR) repeat protein
MHRRYLHADELARPGAMRVSGTPISSVDQLRFIEAQVAQQPRDAALRFERARCLDDLGLVKDAMLAYRELIEANSGHFGALTNLGTLFLEQGMLEGAAACFYGALRGGSADPLAHLNVAAVNAQAGSYDDARRYYEGVLETFADDAQACVHAHHGLVRVYEQLGDAERAEHHRAHAFARPISWTLPAAGTADPLRVLVLSSPHGGDIISNQFFDEQSMERVVIVPESFHPGDPLPDHHVIFNGIADPDRARATLERAAALIARSSASVINDPRAVLETDRAQTMARFGHMQTIAVPRTRRYARAELEAGRLQSDGFAFPLLLRSPGFHAGDHFARIEQPAELTATLATLPGGELYAIEFLDAGDSAGMVRKYRVVFIDGRFFPVHLAIGHHWKVHYFSADMSDSDAFRAEEERFLQAMEATIGVAGMAALTEIDATLGLDYAGVDFGFDRDGRMILFEANAGMAIYPPPEDPRWDYRRAAHTNAIGAMRSLLVERGSRGGAVSRSQRFP